MPRDRIEVTQADIEQALGGNKYSVTGPLKKLLADELTKMLNPPAWKVMAESGRTTPRIRFRDTGIQLHVYVSDPAFGANRDTARTLKIADLVAECLNARGLEVE